MHHDPRALTTCYTIILPQPEIVVCAVCMSVRRVRVVSETESNTHVKNTRSVTVRPIKLTRI